jgi:hypothetical protein
VQIYLFREQGGANNFAYSTDVTGRNIPRPDTRTEWHFVSIVTYRNKSPNFEDVVRHLRRVGFYVFKDERLLAGINHEGLNPLSAKVLPSPGSRLNAAAFSRIGI